MKQLENYKRYLIQSGEDAPTIAIHINGHFVLESDYFQHRDEDPDWAKYAVKWTLLRQMKVQRVPGRTG